MLQLGVGVSGGDENAILQLGVGVSGGDEHAMLQLGVGVGGGHEMTIMNEGGQKKFYGFGMQGACGDFDVLYLPRNCGADGCSCR
jgi:hypothetical protein